MRYQKSLPCLGIAQMGEVARRSRGGGGKTAAPQSPPPPQSLRDSAPIPYGTGEPLFCQTMIYSPSAVTVRVEEK